MVVVTKHNFNSRFVSTICPLCTARIAKDARAWQLHMEVTHSAVDSSWTTLAISGGEQDGLTDGGNTWVKWAHKCWGCGASFSTEALLITHLSSVHSAT